MDGSSDATGFSAIPVVDLSRWGDPTERDAVADEVREICHQIGFFLVVEHGIEPTFIERVFEMMHRLFDLTDEQKALIEKRGSRHFRGWEAVGSELTNNRPDLREQVDLWTEHEARPADAEPAFMRLHGPNQWFPESVLPGYRDLASEWFARMGELADRLLMLLAAGLGLEENHLVRLFGAEPMSLTKFIHYPPTPPGGAGVNAHHDAGFLTVLAAGSTPGLEVQNPAGEWVAVPSAPDAFVINLGEMLQGLTGNYFVATPHRVITPMERYSAGFFHGPSLETRLDPLPLAPELGAAVAASPRHRGAGFMARRHETAAGVGDMESDHRPAVYGEQLWNYFVRSYPDLVELHYGQV